ncbi:MAG: hypothetical protein DI630_11975 [Gordonia sp. (in: high G+C Gram-positive bacteria)]|nr:MAG: hypothetical protein DI630_11975 [Gordonia sp. (in: high G+C Gram-positive bacteria)]
MWVSRIIAAKSYARIHRRNLIAAGVVPLVIGEKAYSANVGQQWQIPGLAKALRNHEPSIEATVVGGDEPPIRLDLDLTPASGRCSWQEACSLTSGKAAGPSSLNPPWPDHRSRRD